MRPMVRICSFFDFNSLKGEDWDTKTLYSEYNVIKKIGQGGFGSVYLGIHKKTGEKVAIKFVNPSAFGDAS